MAYTNPLVAYYFDVAVVSTALLDSVNHRLRFRDNFRRGTRQWGDRKQLMAGLIRDDRTLEVTFSEHYYAKGKRKRDPGAIHSTFSTLLGAVISEKNYWNGLDSAART